MSIPYQISSLLSLLAVFLCAAGSSEPQDASGGGQQRAELETIQNVNFYLLNRKLELEPLAVNERLSGRQLNQMEAIKAELERVKLEIESMDGNELLEMARLDDGLRTLLAAGETDARPLVAFLDSLASDRCDQISLDFLMIVSLFGQAAPQTNRDLRLPVIQNYAKLRVQQCWERFVDSVASSLDCTLGKMAAPLFDFMDKLAARIQARAPAQTETLRRRDKALHIGHELESRRERSGASASIELQDSAPARATIATLKEVQVNTEPERKQFAQSVRELQADYRTAHAHEDRVPALALDLGSFYEELLHQPCCQLIERVQSIVSAGQIFKGHTSQTLGRALAEEKERNVRLDYQLQVYRICKLTSKHHSDIKRQFSVR